MDSVSMAEELAWLIKDNLSCKHLVLSAEEAFVSFLDQHETLSIGNVLTLEPMSSYHRMLLHRLADIFRLAHESIGEGENRRLVLGRCEDSRIPEILVSDILGCNDCVQPCYQAAPLILKRNKDYLGTHNVVEAQSPQLSFEERQAAYEAARQRIFADDGGHAMSETAPRPRSVPVVARRMIAHALGKRILAEQDSKESLAPSGLVSTTAHDTASPSLSTGDQEHVQQSVIDLAHSTVSENIMSCTRNDTNIMAEPIVAHIRCSSADTRHPIDQQEHSKDDQYWQVKSARRMFAQALGLGSSRSASSVSLKTEEKNKNSECLQSVGQVDHDSELLKESKYGHSSVSDSHQPGRVQVRQGKAAQRMLAQALGFHSLPSVAERSRGSRMGVN
ncbi:hypothetical protein KP509_33G007000 [Ceratopteris richardii]|uniref:R3H domain-containing protein n=1 Tax=Ceratopteris richardii TaxID=49495 RepID=A0A8T2QN30_CERRI|nr:hypothetical protein KP509_33G007000 [Ceratopteris richardii]